MGEGEGISSAWAIFSWFPSLSSIWSVSDNIDNYVLFKIMVMLNHFGTCQVGMAGNIRKAPVINIVRRQIYLVSSTLAFCYLVLDITHYFASWSGTGPLETNKTKWNSLNIITQLCSTRYLEKQLKGCHQWEDTLEWKWNPILQLFTLSISEPKLLFVASVFKHNDKSNFI